ncbi:MAG: glycosyltransferase family 39 protein, partial [Acidobacteria bacterium]|nr:glycosyltransferase family 39 protein [Acidobacteriota bacterium]
MALRRWFNSEPRIFWSLAGLALVVRSVGAMTNGVIARDGAVFTDRARWIMEGSLERALEVFPQMPAFYPTLIALLASVGVSLNVAGCVISILAGTATLGPLYLLTRDIWNAKVAALTCLLYALLPQIVAIQADVMSEGLFIFLFLSSAALTWFMLKTPSWSVAVANGFCAALAYQTRSEGIYLVAAAVGWTLLRAIKARGEPDKFAARATLGAALFLLIFLFTAAPYLLWVRAKLGRWGLAVNPYVLQAMKQKEVFDNAFVWDQPWSSPPPAVEMTFSSRIWARISVSMREFLNGLSRHLFFVLPPFLFIGWIRWRRD